MRCQAKFTRLGRPEHVWPTEEYEIQTFEVTLGRFPNMQGGLSEYRLASHLSGCLSLTGKNEGEAFSFSFFSF